MLRSLLPADGGAGILVGYVGPDEVNPNDPEGPTDTLTIEVRGLLPVEAAKYKMAVLGGALAVPCTCNPLQQG